MKLSYGVERYTDWKHTSGYRFERGEVTLLSFSRQVGDVQLFQVKTEDILVFLNRVPVSTITWRLKYWVLYRFFEHWSNRGVMPALVMPTPRPYVRQTFVPYVFTRSELRSLVHATVRHQRSIFRLDQQTLSTVILFLYGTGASIGEAVCVLVSDIDLPNNIIRIRSTRPNRSRQIPLGPDLCNVLGRYMSWRFQMNHHDPHLFITKKGGKVSLDTIAKNFRRLREVAGVCRRDGSRYQPRMDDLRYTFAVHRITAWIENGANLNRMLPALAAYMGQTGLGSTERYLFMTPERFRKDLDKLSPNRGRGRWHDDQELMRFLGAL